MNLGWGYHNCEKWLWCELQ